MKLIKLFEEFSTEKMLEEFDNEFRQKLRTHHEFIDKISPSKDFEKEYGITGVLTWKELENFMYIVTPELRERNMLLKQYETKSTPNEILDLFDDGRLKSYNIDNDFKISILRTKGSFKVVAIERTTNKVVGKVYLQEIKPSSDGYKGELRRLYVNEEYRGRKLGEILLKTIMNTFPEINLYGYPSPNRNKGMDNSNKEEYRERLLKFYDRIGLKKISDKSNRVERQRI